jgi:2-iminobutanoate/2-iminopropanoate deaminase
MSREITPSEELPVAGPSPPAVRAGDTLYVSGQIPLDAATGQLVLGGVAAQTEQALANMKRVLRAAGADFSHVVRATVYLADMADFGEMNGVYERHLGESRPARACVAVKALPKGALVEIDCIAYLG